MRYKNASGSIKYQDPNTGIYQDVDGTWYLNDGTPINDFDPKTGAYQEDDGTWYTFQGTPLMNYDKNTSSYQEQDGTWYDMQGNEVLMNTNLYNLLKSYNYDLSNNQDTQASTQKISNNTILSPRINTIKPQNITINPNASNTPKKPSILMPILIGVGVITLGITIYYLTKSKK